MSASLLRWWSRRCVVRPRRPGRRRGGGRRRRADAPRWRPTASAGARRAPRPRPSPGGGRRRTAPPRGESARSSTSPARKYAAASPAVARFSGRSATIAGSPAARYSETLIIVHSRVYGSSTSGDTPTVAVRKRSCTSARGTQPVHVTVSAMPRSVIRRRSSGTASPRPISSSRIGRVLRRGDDGERLDEHVDGVLATHDPGVGHRRHRRWFRSARRRSPDRAGRWRSSSGATPSPMSRRRLLLLLAMTRSRGSTRRLLQGRRRRSRATCRPSLAAASSGATSCWS